MVEITHLLGVAVALVAVLIAAVYLQPSASATRAHDLADMAHRTQTRAQPFNLAEIPSDSQESDLAKHSRVRLLSPRCLCCALLSRTAQIQIRST